MRKLVLGILFTLIFVFSVISAPVANAEGVEDIPSANYDGQILSVGKEYARSFSCQAATAKMYEPWTESAGYTRIKSNGTKGYVQNAARGGVTLGVVLKDTTIDFSYSHLVKKSYAGNKASYVKGIQVTLKCLGYYTGTVDGIYGDGSEAAVKAFQKRRGLTVDGQVGKKTYHYLSFAAY
ncbi:peptidoglycan-binding domain-containing protein [Peribacillus sp. NPDC094092]|uniref:peptidoglycan-binding domain-containing protein n=1 Tax=Peribacillus sp. NPDC094092 TaxID=3390611 RepID=UPI003CFCDB50